MSRAYIDCLFWRKKNATVSIVSRPQSYCGLSAEVKVHSAIENNRERNRRMEKYNTTKVNQIFRENFEKKLRKTMTTTKLVILNLKFRERVRKDPASGIL